MASRGINKAILIGHLGQNPEIRYMSNGTAITNFSLATSETWRDKQTGETKQKTEWHRIVIFGKLAEIAKEYLHKGSQVYIEGFIQTRNWKDQNGQNRYTTEIIVNIGGTMQMLGGRNSSEGFIEDNNQIKEWKSSEITKKNDQTSLKNDHKNISKNITNNKNENELDFDDDIPF